MEAAKDLAAIVVAGIALAALVKGVIEYMHANTLRRYEKFHAMAVRFDADPCILAVRRLLNGTGTEPVSPQQKEVFIRFLEEVYFMVRSGVMKPEVALYTFGGYARLAARNERFWNGLDKTNPFYRYFRRLAEMADSYVPEADPQPSSLRY